MKDLNNIREEIDLLDKDLIEIFEKRMDLVKYVINYKIDNDLDIFDSSREKYILEKNRKILNNKEYEKYLDEFFISLMKISKDMQNKILRERVNE